jgi:hypothetical protein
MIVLAIIATIAAVLWTAFVVFANGMSDAPSVGFQGEWSIIGAWGVTAALWLAWLVR